MSSNDTLSPQAKRMLESLGAEAPLPQDKERIEAALMAQVATVATVAVATHTVGSAVSKGATLGAKWLTLKSLGIVLAVTGTAVGVTLASAKRNSPKSHTVEKSGGVAAAIPLEAEAVKPESLPSLPPPVELPKEPLADKDKESAKKQKKKPPESPRKMQENDLNREVMIAPPQNFQNETTLKAETELLAAARHAVSIRKLERASELVNRHRAEFPSGVLSPERDIIEARIHCLEARGFDSESCK